MIFIQFYSICYSILISPIQYFIALSFPIYFNNSIRCGRRSPEARTASSRTRCPIQHSIATLFHSNASIWLARRSPSARTAWSRTRCRRHRTARSPTLCRACPGCRVKRWREMEGKRWKIRRGKVMSTFAQHSVTREQETQSR
jgi:hypothetical protein